MTVANKVLNLALLILSVAILVHNDTFNEATLRGSASSWAQVSLFMVLSMSGLAAELPLSSPQR
jgi:hypothetical protein